MTGTLRFTKQREGEHISRENVHFEMLCVRGKRSLGPYSLTRIPC